MSSEASKTTVLKTALRWAQGPQGEDLAEVTIGEERGVWWGEPWGALYGKRVWRGSVCSQPH